MDGSRLFASILIAISLSGCAIVKTTDITDAAYKRHQSISVLGWPLYSRVTDRDRGVIAQVATSVEPSERDSRVRTAELFGHPIELEE
jgi:hypothetical protein